MATKHCYHSSSLQKNQEVKPQNMASLLQLFYQYYFNIFFGYHWLTCCSEGGKQYKRGERDPHLNIFLNIRVFFSKDQISSLNTEILFFIFSFCFFLFRHFECRRFSIVRVSVCFAGKLFFLSLFRVQQLLFLLASSYTSRYLLRCLVVSCQ
jgi:hypothetical protein